MPAAAQAATLAATLLLAACSTAAPDPIPASAAPPAPLSSAAGSAAISCDKIRIGGALAADVTALAVRDCRPPDFTAAPSKGVSAWTDETAADETAAPPYLILEVSLFNAPPPEPGILGMRPDELAINGFHRVPLILEASLSTPDLTIDAIGAQQMPWTDGPIWLQVFARKRITDSCFLQIDIMRKLDGPATRDRIAALARQMVRQDLSQIGAAP